MVAMIGKKVIVQLLTCSFLVLLSPPSSSSSGYLSSSYLSGASKYGNILNTVQTEAHHTVRMQIRAEYILMEVHCHWPKMRCQKVADRPGLGGGQQQRVMQRLRGRQRASCGGKADAIYCAARAITCRKKWPLASCW